MRNKLLKKESFVGALALTAAALLSPASAPAQVAPAEAPADTTPTTSVQRMPDPVTAPAPTDESVATVLGVDSGPTAIVADSAGNLWVTLQFANKVAKIGSGGNVLAQYATGRNPTGIAAGANIWVANNQDSTLTKLALTGAVVGTYKSGGDGPQAVLLAGKFVWVANERSNTVTRLTPDGLIVGTYPVGSRPTALAADAAGNIWVTNNKANTVTKLSPEGALLGTYPVGRGPYGIAAVGDDVFVSCFVDGVVMRVNGSTGMIMSKIIVGDGPATIANYGSYYIVAGNGTNTLTIFSETGTVYSSIRVGRSPLGVAATGSGYWVANTGSGSVSRR